MNEIDGSFDIGKCGRTQRGGVQEGERWGANDKIARHGSLPRLSNRHDPAPLGQIWR